MKVFQVHNFYQQPGGEDQVYAAEHALLTRHGHTVEQYALHNDDIHGMSAPSAALRTLWNARTFSEARSRIRGFKPAVVHCHNTFPLISPAIYYAAAAEHVPVVQTIHNYRLLCPAATLFRQGQVCQDCMPHSVPYPAVLHACYRGSRPASAVVAALLTVHRAVGTWQRKVNRFIATSEFVKRKHVEGGLPAHLISTKPNFVMEDISPGTGDGGYALYVGRLAEEKGIRTLLAAWERLGEIPLRIVGDGPLRPLVESYCRRLPHITLLGFRARPEALEQMRSASCVVLSSVWFEGLPLAALEAMACGTPLVASDLGSLPEVAVEGFTGVRFPPGDPEKLAAAVRELLSDRARLAALRVRTRAYYETNFTPEANYAQLMSIYRQAGAACYA